MQAAGLLRRDSQRLESQRRIIAQLRRGDRIDAQLTFIQHHAGTYARALRCCEVAIHDVEIRRRQRCDHDE